MSHTMKPALIVLVLVAVLAGLALLPAAVFADPPVERPHDPTPLFRSGVPHRQAVFPSSVGPTITPTPEVSATFGGSSYTPAGNVPVTTTEPAAETHIAADPTDAGRLIAAISDFGGPGRGGFNTTKYAYSTDNGATWGESYMPYDSFFTGFLTTGDTDVPGGVYWLANSDPVVAIGGNGTAYLASLYFDGGFLGSNANGIYVGKDFFGTNGTLQLTTGQICPAVRNLDSGTQRFEDKEWMTVDNGVSSSRRGRLYVSWTRFVGQVSNMIMITWSDNPGQTCTPADWSKPKQVSLRSQNGAVQGSQVAVGPNGEIYVVYVVYYINNQRRLFLTKSTNGGARFSSPKAITPYFNELTFESSYRKFSLPSLAVNPVNGDVYVAYADQPDDTVGAQVKFVRSTNGGGTFSEPVTINDASAGHQFFPAVTADANGVVHVAWFDTRNGPGGGSSFYDIYATYALDGGATFAPNTRVTATTQDVAGTSFIGDYMGIAAAANQAHPVWSTSSPSSAPGHMETDVLSLPTP